MTVGKFEVRCKIHVSLKDSRAVETLKKTSLYPNAVTAGEIDSTELMNLQSGRVVRTVFECWKSIAASASIGFDTVPSLLIG